MFDVLSIQINLLVSINFIIISKSIILIWDMSIAFQSKIHNQSLFWGYYSLTMNTEILIIFSIKSLIYVWSFYVEELNQYSTCYVINIKILRDEISKVTYWSIEKKFDIQIDSNEKNWKLDDFGSQYKNNYYCPDEMRKGMYWNLDK